MAIISEIVTEYGVSCNYSKISKTVFHSNRVEITLDSFVSQESRVICNRPLVSNVFVIECDNPIEAISASGMNHVKWAYMKLIEISHLALLTEEENPEIYLKYAHFDKTMFPFIGDEE